MLDERDLPNLPIYVKGRSLTASNGHQYKEVPMAAKILQRNAVFSLLAMGMCGQNSKNLSAQVVDAETCVSSNFLLMSLGEQLRHLTLVSDSVEFSVHGTYAHELRMEQSRSFDVTPEQQHDIIIMDVCNAITSIVCSPETQEFQDSLLWRALENCRRDGPTLLTITASVSRHLLTRNRLPAHWDSTLMREFAASPEGEPWRASEGFHVHGDGRHADHAQAFILFLIRHHCHRRCSTQWFHVIPRDRMFVLCMVVYPSHTRPSRRFLGWLRADSPQWDPLRFPPALVAECEAIGVNLRAPDLSIAALPYAAWILHERIKWPLLQLLPHTRRAWATFHECTTNPHALMGVPEGTTPLERTVFRFVHRHYLGNERPFLLANRKRAYTIGEHNDTVHYDKQCCGGGGGGKRRKAHPEVPDEDDICRHCLSKCVPLEEMGFVRATQSDYHRYEQIGL